MRWCGGHCPEGLFRGSRCRHSSSRRCMRHHLQLGDGDHDKDGNDNDGEGDDHQRRSSRLPTPSASSSPLLSRSSIQDLVRLEPSKPKAPLLSLFLFFVCSICRPKQRVNVLATGSTPAASPLQRPPPRRRRQPTVGCCIPPSSGSHPRQVLHPSLIF